MKFGMLVQVLFWGVTVRAYFFILTVGRRQFRVLVLIMLWDAVCGELFEVLVTVRPLLGCYRACR